MGLWLDRNKRWSYHADQLIKKLNLYQYALHNLSKIASREAVLSAYHAYVSSTLRYGIIFWGNCTDRELIFKTQKKCLRAVCQIKVTDSCRPYFVKLEIMTVPCLYIYEVAIFVKKHIHLFATLRSKRHQNTILVNSHRSALFAKSILGMGPKIFNKIPSSVRNISDFNKFKRVVSDYLIKKAYYSINEFFNEK